MIYLLTIQHADAHRPAMQIAFTELEDVAAAIDSEVEELQARDESARWDLTSATDRYQRRLYVEKVSDMYVRDTPLTEATSVHANEWNFTVAPVELIQKVRV